MKFLLVFFVVLVAVWRWRTARAEAVRMRSQPTRATTEQSATPQEPVAMVRCRHCGVHLAQIEAVAGRNGVYCGREHLAVAES